MTKIKKSVVALVAALGLAGTATFAVAVTPTGDDTVGNLTVRTVQTPHTNLISTYTAGIANCPDSSWVAVAGGYYFADPALVDDITIRASQRNEGSNGIQGWMVSAKADSIASGETREIVVEATCVKTAP